MLTDPPLWRDLIQIPDYAAGERRISPRWLQSIGFVAETRPSTYRLDVATVEAPDLTLFVMVTFVGSFETILIGNQYRSGGKSQALCTTSRRPISRGELLDLLDWLQRREDLPRESQPSAQTLTIAGETETLALLRAFVADAEELARNSFGPGDEQEIRAEWMEADREQFLLVKRAKEVLGDD